MIQAKFNLRYKTMMVVNDYIGLQLELEKNIDKNKVKRYLT
ncbi:hypothetical protein OAL81_00960 [Candidatus Pelagibacter sp.]|nr:hypothetical protein [Candidatus Pelagibacter sp.]|tara:strand:- start:238 stop:360 length:123 start_codon:yes stop_codon:yes gene_type:complete